VMRIRIADPHWIGSALETFRTRFGRESRGVGLK
jgi:hypothetical protein